MEPAGRPSGAAPRGSSHALANGWTRAWSSRARASRTGQSASAKTTSASSQTTELHSGGSDFERDVEQPLLLPHHIGAAELDQDPGIVRREFEPVAIRQLDRDQRDAKAAAEEIVVGAPQRRRQRIEVACDAPNPTAGTGRLAGHGGKPVSRAGDQRRDLRPCERG